MPDELVVYKIIVATLKKLAVATQDLGMEKKSKKKTFLKIIVLIQFSSELFNDFSICSFWIWII